MTVVRRHLSTLGALVVLVAFAGCSSPDLSGTGRSEPGRSTTSPPLSTFKWQDGPRVALPVGWEGLGSGTIGGHAYTDVDLAAHSVRTVRFWPDILQHALFTDSVGSLESIFGRESVYLLVLETRVDPFPGLERIRVGIVGVADFAGNRGIHAVT